MKKTTAKNIQDKVEHIQSLPISKRPIGRTIDRTTTKLATGQYAPSC